MSILGSPSTAQIPWSDESTTPNILPSTPSPINIQPNFKRKLNRLTVLLVVLMLTDAVWCVVSVVAQTYNVNSIPEPFHLDRNCPHVYVYLIALGVSAVLGLLSILSNIFVYFIHSCQFDYITICSILANATLLVYSVAFVRPTLLCGGFTLYRWAFSIAFVGVQVILLSAIIFVGLKRHSVSYAIKENYRRLSDQREMDRVAENIRRSKTIPKPKYDADSFLDYYFNPEEKITTTGTYTQSYTQQYDTNSRESNSSMQTRSSSLDDIYVDRMSFYSHVDPNDC